MIKVLWISNIPSPYKIELMNLLGQKVDLTCYFEDSKSEDRDDKWYGKEFDNFKHIYLKDNLVKDIKRLLKNNDFDILINSDYSRPHCILATLLFRLKGKPVIIQADGGIAIDRGFIVNTGISMVMKMASGYLSSGYETDKYFKFYGINENNIYHYKFTSLNKEDILANRELSKQKEFLKAKCGYAGKKIFISVGRPIYLKGFDVLIKAYSKVANDDTVLMIVGGLQQEENMNLVKSLGVNSVEFVDFQEKEKLNEIYAMCDYFALATRSDVWGLVINEAMSFGLPVVSTDKCVSAVEFNNVGNCTLISPVDDVDDFAKNMKKLIQDDELANRLKNESLEVISEYTVENTAEGYYEAIKRII